MSTNATVPETQELPNGEGNAISDGIAAVEQVNPSSMELYDITDGSEYTFYIPDNGVMLPMETLSAPGAENMRILLASDCHLGVRDREPLVKEDSLRTFEEVLQIAKAKNADMIFMAGDLFHQNRPSRQVVCKTVEILEKYCLGDRPVSVRFISNPAENFASACSHFRTPNWEDPNINIELPIFSIHGNHDDPIGPTNLCELDTLHTQRLINYFGKIDDLNDIEVKPILLQKGNTYLALYGMGSIKDERLNHMLRNGKVKFVRPAPFQSPVDGRPVHADRDIFSVLLFHQVSAVW
nr:MRE11 [Halechiniscus sp.]